MMAKYMVQIWCLYVDKNFLVNALISTRSCFISAFLTEMAKILLNMFTNTSKEYFLYFYLYFCICLINECKNNRIYCYVCNLSIIFLCFVT